jgi:UPF0755 protein
MRASRVIKIVLILFIAGTVFAGLKAFGLYRKAFIPNVYIKGTKEVYLYIPTNSNYNYVFEELKTQNLLKNPKSFNWTAHRKNYHNLVKPGRYRLKNRMSNNTLINMLRSGNQEAVKLTFNNTNTLQGLCNRVANQLEFSSNELMLLLSDKETLKNYGFTSYTIPAMFIPNTYELYWNTTPQGFLDRMKKEYDDFWTRSRTAKAEKLGMTKNEVTTLASIVQKEVIFNDEKRRVAGLYVNRLNKNIRLQADPTLIFAMGDYSIRRVLNTHKKLESPYNTYTHDGLPPGPICIPDIASIDAVLNYEKHKYIYMCAKPDFSGYHNFAKTLSQHNKNAEAYRRELNKRRIYN